MARLKNSQNAFASLDDGSDAVATHKSTPSQAGESKIPVGWALLALGAGCAVFWGVIAAVL